MKIIKYLFVFVLLIALGVSVWWFYPQYQIYKMKQDSVAVSKNADHTSYISYFRDSHQPQLHHLALGDSIIRGYGAGDNEDLVSQFSHKLAEQTHKKIDFENQGINGITSGELSALVQSGKLDESIKKSNIITINVGGNDLLQLAGSEDISSVLKQYDQLQLSFSKNLTDISTRITKLNPKATVVFLELYNPLSPDHPMYSLADKMLPKWNVHIYEVSNHIPGSLVIETTKVINGDNLQNLSTDGVHPNPAGYAAISDQMIYQFKHQTRKSSV